MKYLLGLVLILTLLSASEKKFYLLTTHDPHVTEEVFKYAKIEKNFGRIVLVSKSPKIPKNLKQYLKEVTLDDIKVYQPENVAELIPSETVLNLINDVKPQDVKNIVSKVSSFSNRSAGTEDNYQATLWIQKQFESYGYKTKLDCFRTKYCNVIAYKQSPFLASEFVLAEAHLDSVGRTKAGADDNASGVAGLLLMAKQLSNVQTRRSLIFFATNGEERGLLGAKDYVNKLKKSRTINQIKFVINMDMIGFNKNGLVDIETNREYENLAKWYSSLVNTYTTLSPNITMPAWGSDHVPFLNEGIPSILTIEHWKTKTPCYHSGCDKPGHLNYEYAAEIVKLNIAAMKLKADE